MKQQGKHGGHGAYSCIGDDKNSIAPQVGEGVGDPHVPHWIAIEPRRREHRDGGH